MKIVVVTPIPTPYRDPFWSEVARQPGVDLQVFYCASGKADRPWNVNWEQAFAHESLPGRNLLGWRGADASCYWNPAILGRLRQAGPDVVIVGGYNHLTMWSAMRHAVRQRIPYALMCETYRQSGPWSLKGALKRPLVSWAVKNAAVLLPTGIRAEQYLKAYGGPADRMVRLPNVPDVLALQTRATERRGHRNTLRQKLGLTGDPLVLFVGRLIPKKRAEVLLRAFHRAEVPGHLAIVGDGPEALRLKGLAAELGVADRVHFPGFVAPEAVADWYAACDLFVLPSSETWGVVVLEAVASGLPVIVTDKVGCQPDVVSDDSIGSVVPMDDEFALATTIRRRLELSRGMSPVLPSAVRDYSYRSIAQRIVERLRITSVGESAAIGTGL